MKCAIFSLVVLGISGAAVVAETSPGAVPVSPGAEESFAQVQGPPMNLYLMRHGVATERDPHSFPDDSRRPLTLKGEDRVRLCGDAFQALDLSFDVILASPFLRARQTAELVASGLGLRRQLHFSETLQPAGDLKALLRVINRLKPVPEEVLLVGHEPDLSHLLSVLISGQADAAIELKRNSLAKIEVHGRLRLARCAVLNWLLSPRQLGLLA